MTPTQQTARTHRRLRIVRVFALIDLVLLLMLVFAALTGRHGAVQVLGPVHGINFLLLLVIVGVGAIDGLWAWWFPLAVLLTAGPPGAFVGEWIIQRRMKGQKAALLHDVPLAENAEVVTRGPGAPDVPSFSTEERRRDE